MIPLHNNICSTGTDEIALNVEMGLYRDFEVTDGVIHGCPGLEIFNETMTTDDGKPVWSGPNGKYNGELLNVFGFKNVK